MLKSYIPSITLTLNSGRRGGLLVSGPKMYRIGIRYTVSVYGTPYRYTVHLIGIRYTVSVYGTPYRYTVHRIGPDTNNIPILITQHSLEIFWLRNMNCVIDK
jgi:hypothetical protein